MIRDSSPKNRVMLAFSRGFSASAQRGFGDHSGAVFSILKVDARPKVEPPPADLRRLARTEHRVGDPCAPADHPPELMPVHLPGDRWGGVPAQIGDRLDGHPAVTHDRDERVTQLARRPGLPDPRLPGDEPEHPPPVRRVQRPPGRRAEHQPAVATRLSRPEALGGSVRVMPAQCVRCPQQGVPASDAAPRLRNRRGARGSAGVSFPSASDR